MPTFPYESGTGGGGTVDTVARSGVNEISTPVGQAVPEGESTFNFGRLWLNPEGSGGPINVAASAAAMEAAGFVEGDLSPDTAVDEVVVTNVDLTGAAPADAKTGINQLNGKEFYVDAGGDWQEFPSAGGVSYDVAETKTDAERRTARTNAGIPKEYGSDQQLEANAKALEAFQNDRYIDNLIAPELLIDVIADGGSTPVSRGDYLERYFDWMTSKAVSGPLPITSFARTATVPLIEMGYIFKNVDRLMRFKSQSGSSITSLATAEFTQIAGRHWEVRFTTRVAMDPVRAVVGQNFRLENLVGDGDAHALNGASRFKTIDADLMGFTCDIYWRRTANPVDVTNFDNTYEQAYGLTRSRVSIPMSTLLFSQDGYDGGNVYEGAWNFQRCTGGVSFQEIGFAWEGNPETWNGETARHDLLFFDTTNVRFIDDVSLVGASFGGACLRATGNSIIRHTRLSTGGGLNQGSSARSGIRVQDGVQVIGARSSHGLMKGDVITVGESSSVKDIYTSIGSGSAPYASYGDGIILANIGRVAGSNAAGRSYDTRSRLTYTNIDQIRNDADATMVDGSFSDLDSAGNSNFAKTSRVPNSLLGTSEYRTEKDVTIGERIIGSGLIYQPIAAALAPIVDADIDAAGFTTGTADVAQTQNIGGVQVTIQGSSSTAPFNSNGIGVMVGTPNSDGTAERVTLSFDPPIDNLSIQLTNFLQVSAALRRELANIQINGVAAVAADITVGGGLTKPNDTTIAATAHLEDGPATFNQTRISTVSWDVQGAGTNTGFDAPRLSLLSGQPQTPILPVAQNGTLKSINGGAAQMFDVAGVEVADYTIVPDFVTSVDDITTLDPDTVAEAYQTGATGAGAGHYYSIDIAGNRDWAKA